MAEISLGVVGVAFPIANGLLELHHKLRQVARAPMDIEDFKRETRTLSKLFGLFEEGLENSLEHLAEKHRERMLSVARDLIGHISSVEEMVELATEKILYTFDNSEGTVRRLIAQWKWALQKSSIDDVREAMRLFASQLHLFNSTLLIRELLAKIEKLKQASIPDELTQKLDFLTKMVREERREARRARKNLENLVAAQDFGDESNISREQFRSLKRLGRNMERVAESTAKASRRRKAATDRHSQNQRPKSIFRNPRSAASTGYDGPMDGKQSRTAVTRIPASPLSGSSSKSTSPLDSKGRDSGPTVVTEVYGSRVRDDGINVRVDYGVWPCKVMTSRSSDGAEELSLLPCDNGTKCANVPEKWSSERQESSGVHSVSASAAGRSNRRNLEGVYKPVPPFNGADLSRMQHNFNHGKH